MQEIAGPPIEATQHKLDEARFFYQLLVNEQQQNLPSSNEPHAFRYYLSAFLSAGTSVSEALSHEAKRKNRAKYLAWERKWKKQLTTEEQSPAFLRAASTGRLTPRK